MPLVEREPDAPPLEKEVPIRINEPTFRGVTVDTRYIPTSHLLTAIEGSSWKVDYYSQVLGSDNELNGQLINRDPTLQQYQLIKGLELKVSQALMTNQDPTTKFMTETGAAHIYPFLKPNVGDMFLADIGDGREGAFKVTSSEKRSIFKDTCYFIEYELVDYNNKIRNDDLTAKVVKTFYFLRDFLYYGQNPMVEEEQYGVIRELKSRYPQLVENWVQRFFSREYKTFILPAQDSPTYDRFLAKAVSQVFETHEAVQLQHLRLLNVEDDVVFKCKSIWDAIVKRDSDELYHVFERVGTVSTRLFTQEPMMEGIRYTGISRILYPKDAQVSVDYETQRTTKEAESDTIVAGPPRSARLDDLILKADQAGLPYAGSPLIKDVLVDDYYIFSAAFYENTAGQSKLEHAVHDHIRGQYVDPRLLLAFCDIYHAWGALERFYYTPIVLMMMQTVIRSI